MVNHLGEEVTEEIFLLLFVKEIVQIIEIILVHFFALPLFIPEGAKVRRSEVHYEHEPVLVIVSVIDALASRTRTRWDRHVILCSSFSSLRN